MSDWKATAQAALERLNDERHGEKMKATVLAIVDAHLAGVSEETVWGREETCSRRIYHQKWKKHAGFSAALDEVDRLAREWRDDRRLNALSHAAELLRLAAPDAVDRLVAIMGQAEDLTNSRLAAVAVLDRAGMETASKSSSSVEMDIDVSALSDEELQAITGSTGGG